MTSTMSSAPRVPFTEISGARLQNLQSLKNRQNALSSPSNISVKSSTKRTIEIFADDSDADTENIDPVSYSSPSKRSKGIEQDFVKPRLVLQKISSVSKSTTASTVALAANRPILKTRTPRKSSNMSATMITTTLQSQSAPVGRSPRRQQAAALNRRRTIQRIEPPSFTLSASAISAPFSIATALSGTLSSYKSKMPPPPIVKKASRSSGDFIIHEDTKEEEAQIMMEHCANTLDLSGDENDKKGHDEENKENIAPDDDVSQTGLRLRGGTGSGKEEMECDRKVLGEVDVSDLYDDLDAKILVEDDEETDVSSQPEIINPAVEAVVKNTIYVPEVLEVSEKVEDVLLATKNEHEAK